MKEIAPADRLSILRDIYSDVLQWLHFAEAKNAALATLNSAAIIGVATVYSQLNSTPLWLCWAMAVVSGFFLSSLLLGILSFMPRLSLLPWSGTPTAGKPGNVWFFGHIAAMGVDGFLKELSRKSDTKIGASELESDLAQQIVVNSKIAVKKYAIFKLALWITLSGVITPVGTLILYWLFIDEAV
ncbi:hypothetical protein ELG79_36615 [Rhizobium leguminosarum]|uniref:Pycsar system effector family protein n=1 Tax=Rhizobium leguminosarum TaxID=384 RepID=UPI001031D881|nr:Pycsar system effector family protein [Rhizobium leguminosarum]TBG08446.1 hypothetical protein ELG79_36615 [Rhizobium leguminosarum]